MHGRDRAAEQLAAEHPDYFMPQQFEQPRQSGDPPAHDGPGDLDAVRTRRRLRRRRRHRRHHHGVGEVLRERDARRQIVAVEPETSPVLAGGEPGFHKIQGIGAGFVPDNLNTMVYDEVLAVSDDEATEYTRAIAREEGLLVGISSGANSCAAVRVARRLGRASRRPHRVLRHGRALPDDEVFQAEGI